MPKNDEWFDFISLVLSLSMVPGSPIKPNDTFGPGVLGIADDLREACITFAEAEALVREARRTWTAWLGTPGLLKLLEEMRDKDLESLRGLGVLRCGGCQGTGRVDITVNDGYCTCQMGRDLRITENRRNFDTVGGADS